MIGQGRVLILAASFLFVLNTVENYVSRDQNKYVNLNQFLTQFIKPNGSNVQFYGTLNFKIPREIRKHKVRNVKPNQESLENYFGITKHVHRANKTNRLEKSASELRGNISKSKNILPSRSKFQISAQLRHPSPQKARLRSDTHEGNEDGVENHKIWQTPELDRNVREFVRKRRTVVGLTNTLDELILSTWEIIERNGYPVERHWITTTDGYILALTRIPGPRQTLGATPIRGANPNVVFLAHCAACSSADYVLSGPDNALGLVLADAGYDVWLGDFRGNTYSRNHTRLDPDRDSEFWHFSLDEIASIDIPALVEYVTAKTGVHKIFYIGHSLGTLAFYMSASTPRSVVAKVRLMVGLGPVGFRDNVRGVMALFMQMASIFRGPMEALGLGELMSRKTAAISAAHTFCCPTCLFPSACLAVFTALGGGVNRGHFDQERLPLYMAHLPSAGISVRALAHIGQFITSNGTQKFDFGASENVRRYGTTRPPRYDLSAVTCPTALYWAVNDQLAAAKDVVRLAAALPNLVKNETIDVEDFNHFDFLVSSSARELVYDSILELMRQF